MKITNIGPKSIAIVSAVLVLLGLYLTSTYSYLLFHSLAELFSIVVAFGVFLIAWNSRRFLDNNYILLLGIAFFFIGALDLVHVLAYEGMGVFQGYDSNLPTQLWIATRYIQSLSLLIAPFLFKRRLRPGLIFLGYAVAISFLLASIFYWNIFPVSFVEGAGVTAFKKVSEYIIATILIAAMILLLKNGRRFERNILQLLVASILLSVLSELAFTFYVTVYGLANLLGHFLKLIAFYFIYKALVETGLTKPYNLLFRSLELSERRYHDIFGAAGEGIITWDTSDVIQSWNKAAEEILGYKAEEVIGRTYYFLVPEDLRESGEPERLREGAKEAGGTGKYETQRIRKDGARRDIETIRTALRDDEGNITAFVSIFSDVTERRQMQERLIASQRLATLGQFSGNISHELRNPLGVIDSSAYYLKRRLKNADEKVVEHLDRIKSSVDNSNAIIESLLSLTRMKEPQMGRLDLKAVTSDAIATTRVPPGVRVIQNTRQPEIWVNADQEQLRMAFKNIVTNAIEAMDGKGTLTVTVRRTGDNEAEVSFADTGTGIATENLERVFQPLFSTKARGIGFGLSITKMIIDKHGGSIEARSEPEKGATLIIRLPLHTNKAEEGE